MASSQLPNESGIPFRVTTSGATAITVNANILGIFSAVGAATTAPTVNLYVGSTAASAPLVFGTCTLALNSFTRVPAYCSGGFTFVASNDHVDLTIYWNPASAT